MKKKKLESLLSILIIFSSGFLIANTYIEKLNSDCQLEISEMNDNMTQSWFWMTMSVGESNFLTTGLLIQNFTTIVPEGNGHSVSIFVPPEFRNITSSYFNNTIDFQKMIFELADNIQEKRIHCNNLSFWATISLYIALIINMVSLLVSLIIFRKSKTK